MFGLGGSWRGRGGACYRCCRCCALGLSRERGFVVAAGAAVGCRVVVVLRAEVVFDACALLPLAYKHSAGVKESATQSRDV